jgi:signal peptidase I
VRFTHHNVRATQNGSVSERCRSGARGAPYENTRKVVLDAFQKSFSTTMTHTLTTQKPKRMAWLAWGFPGFVVLGALALFFAPVRVTGNSMSPTLHDGQVLLLQRHLPFIPSTYQKDELVVLRPPQELQSRASRYVKRVVAAPGDSLSIREGKVYLNNQELYEPYVAEHSSLPDNFPELLVSKGEVIAFEGFALSELPEYLQATFEMLEPLPGNILGQSSKEAVTYIGAIKLKEGFYFVLGDNRGFSASEDSRLFGAVSGQSILGTAMPLW